MGVWVAASELVLPPQSDKARKGLRHQVEVSAYGGVGCCGKASIERA